jgi:molecular chaperone HscB
MSTPSTETRCWSCSTTFDAGTALTCPSCGVVAPPHPRATPFARLGVEERFDLDAAALERAWLQRSRAVHPDRFARKSDQERRYAAEQTAALNDAWRAIKDPFDRASWLVKSRGVDVAKLDQRLLMELMEARERAEESPAEKAAVVAEAKARFEALAAGLGGQMAKLDDKPALDRAGKTLAEMKTLARLVHDLGGQKLIATLEDR